MHCYSVNFDLGMHEIARYMKIRECYIAILRNPLLQVFMVELTRGWNSRLGFSLQPEGNCTVISVVHPDSVAAKDGRLRQGDVLLMVSLFHRKFIFSQFFPIEYALEPLHYYIIKCTKYHKVKIIFIYY